jgi:hypothetical protein
MLYNELKLKGCFKMRKITVNIKSLQEKLLQIEKDGMGLVELYIVPSQTEGENTYPTFLHFEGVSESGSYTDYEGIDEFSVADCLLMHKSA